MEINLDVIKNDSLLEREIQLKSNLKALEHVKDKRLEHTRKLLERVIKYSLKIINCKLNFEI